MKKQINDYLKYLENNKVDKKELIVKISFYQHERLIHLIVTCLVAISAILFTFMGLLLNNYLLLIVSIILFILFTFYIIHYYFLENSIQKMYLYYDKIKQ